ncbi:hypothetical protein [Acetitomaculum ruminis]|uniref:hypothetical protein n=1 Tax=Acetitomaculum ruminis TaxID=2382 RepID=UPI0015A54ACF|nr:hypothetical protein [Acetitomaculum ruminis]
MVAQVSVSKISVNPADYSKEPVYSTLGSGSMIDDGKDSSKSVYAKVVIYCN